MNGRWKSVDTLRGLAIFSVVLFHVGDAFPGAFPGVLAFFGRWGGYFGNYLFFMISGLCVSAGYRERIANGEIKFLPFMRRRLVRLYPLYFLTELICAAFLIRYGGAERLNPRELIQNLLCISCGWFENNLPYNFPCWFLSVLLQMYIIHFAVQRLFQRKAPYVFALLAAWGKVIIKAGFHSPFCYAQNGEGLSNYFIGCLLFELLGGVDRRYRKIGAGAALGLLFILPAVGLPGEDAITFLLCPLLIFAVIDWEPAKRVMESPKLNRAFGNVSMYIFFWHIPVLRAYTYLLGRFSWYHGMPAQWRLAGYLILLYAFCRTCALAALAVQRKEGAGSSA